ncbi:pirin family protein [Magnetospirillum molischianum]|uniref:Putative Pirin family protein n=1 Tax=Magnetospirillum molischianum DSM 120 TaxID=1150626 RepID=H8FP96_MAGML|nr:pirin family protein [Magnetospirillum molischianum]CCG40184.1 putative Pirin family protein [Magnetospirillum molischianum DSM 120]
MSLVLRPADERGHANHGWLDSHHTFSFADYYDSVHMGFRALRVINEDIVRPGTGFGMHGHRDMEIVSYVVGGVLAHEDTTGSKGVLRRGDIQYMSAGTGIRHSEVNGSQTEDVHLLQIWIEPPRLGLPPSYRQQTVPDASKRNVLRLIAGQDGSDGVLTTHRDVRVYAGMLEPGASVTHQLQAGRGVWLQLVDGTLDVNGVAMAPGDGAAIEREETIRITSRSKTEFLLFDLD